MNPKLVISAVHFRYRRSGADFSLDINDFSLLPGEVCYLFGPSGCGKTTFLDLAAGILSPQEGARRLQPPDATLCYVMQKTTLLPWLSIRDNIALEAKFRRMAVPDSLMADNSAAVDLRPGDLAKTPSQLSGGMKCRADILRALCMGPDLLFMDEAFANMDYNRRLSIFRHLSPRVDAGMSILACSHDVNEVMAIADRVLVFAPEGSQADHYEVTLATPRHKRDADWYHGEEGMGIRQKLGWRFEPAASGEVVGESSAASAACS